MGLHSIPMHDSLELLMDVIKDLTIDFQSLQNPSIGILEGKEGEV
jgi:hypothetical protein